MAGSSLFALIDDIATLLDDISVMAKVATKKTAGVLGDDLALNAEQVAGVRAERELPVVWAVAKGSLVNKAILVPVALGIGAVAPWLILPLLIIGGAFLCYEGFHKVAEALFHKKEEKHEKKKEHVQAVIDPSVDLVALEKSKIKGAIRTDFVLSAEIVVITLGTVARAPFGKKAAILALVAVLLTVAVYGLVGLIVKLDDAGLALSKRENAGARAVGAVLLRGAPFLMKSLSVVGTVAMFLVGGGIVAHGIPWLHHSVDHLGAAAGKVPAVGWLTKFLVEHGSNALIGLVVGAVVSGGVAMGVKLYQKVRKPA